MIKPLSKDGVKKALESWPGLNRALMGFTLKQVEQLIKSELNGKRRKSYLQRLVKRKFVLMRIEAFKEYGL